MSRRLHVHTPITQYSVGSRAQYVCENILPSSATGSFISFTSCLIRAINIHQVFPCWPHCEFYSALHCTAAAAALITSPEVHRDGKGSLRHLSQCMCSAQRCLPSSNTVPVHTMTVRRSTAKGCAIALPQHAVIPYLHHTRS